MRLEPGFRLGHYVLGPPLGAGGMGEVYRAGDTKLGRDVALKVLPVDLACDAERLARFQREARAVAALNHPHIVTIYSVEEAAGVHFFTMELVDGQTLDRSIPDGGLSGDRIVRIGVAIADALVAAHDKGIVHRDLKPANVMVTGTGQVKVLDFGLAKISSDDAQGDAAMATALQTRDGVVMGTVPYMSPEQVCGRAVDHRTDLFSLGVILYEMASGRRPFEGASSIELASAILRDTPPLVSDVRGDLPAALAQLIRRCLDKDPRQRIQTAREVSDECHDLARQVSPTSGVHAPARSSSAGGSGVVQRDEGFWVAVLPFKYTGSNADLAALAEGLSEEIVTGLSRFSYLRVVARSSTLRYSREPADVRTVGKEIGARYVMEGSIRQAGSNLRVAVQLVDASTGAHIWAEAYNRPFQPEAIFGLQDDLVPRIVSTVADWYGVLPHSMSETLRSKPSDQLSPYEAVLRSFRYGERRTPEEHATARAGLERAVKLAPDYADGWALLSIIYTEEYAAGFNVQPDPLGRALQAARQAAEAAPSSALAHNALARARFFRKEFQAFRTAAERTIALNPMDGGTIAAMGVLMAYAGDWEHGCAVVERAAELNPSHPGWYWFPLFYNAYRKGDYRGALSAALEINLPHFFYTHVVIAAAYGQLGDREAAAEALRELLVLRPDFALIGRDDLGRWYPPELVDHLIDGLRKAGLDVATGKGAAVTSPVSETAGRTASMMQSIAVLPFANMSTDKDQEYFSDGLAEEIINLLAHVSGLKVIARTSAFAFRGKEQDIRGIAEALGVRTILQGSVRRAGSRIRVSAQLINAADGDHLWSERFDREMTEVFAVQDEIAAAIASALKMTLTGKSADARPHEPNLAAYEAFLKGRHHYYKFSPDAFARAEQDFTRATELDPQWAEPRAALGDLYFALGFYGWRPLDDMIPRARAEARKALALIPSHPMAHAVLGTIAALHDYDWREAEEQFRPARASESLPPNGRMLCALFYLLALGRFDEALQEMAQAIAQDPLNAFWRARQAWVLLCADRHDEAIAEARKALDFDDTNYQARMMIALTLTFQGKLAEAREPAEEVFRVAAYDALNTGLLAGLLARAGEKDRAEHLLATMSGAVTIGVVMYHLVCGDIDAAIDWYQKDIELRRPNAPMIAFAGFLEPLRASPRWPKVASLMNLPPLGPGDGLTVPLDIS